VNIAAYMRARRLDLSASRKAVLKEVCAEMDHRRAVTRVSVRSLARHTGLAPSSVFLALSELQEAKLLVNRHGPRQKPLWTFGPEFPLPREDFPDPVDNTPTVPTAGTPNCTDSEDRLYRQSEQSVPMVGTHKDKKIKRKDREIGAQPPPAPPMAATAAPKAEPGRDDRVLVPGFGRLHPDTAARLRDHPEIVDAFDTNGKP